MNDAEAEAEAVLGAMHHAIRTAQFDELETISAKLETVLSGLGALEGDALALLRGMAERNTNCLAAAAQGLRAGRRRLVEIAAAERADTYDRSGARKALSGPVPGRRL
jgi:ElaB/YqjD/DUF883 family membrane-anchored ribosome-binding protein